MFRVLGVEMANRRQRAEASVVSGQGSARPESFARLRRPLIEALDGSRVVCGRGRSPTLKAFRVAGSVRCPASGILRSG